MSATVEEVRRRNLERLIAEAGTAEALAARVGTSPVYVSQLRHRTLNRGGGAPRSMGSAMARRMEAAFDRPSGWMDREHPAPSGKTQAPSAAESHTNATPGPDVRARVPLISWVRAGTWDDNVDIHQPGIADEWVETTATVGPSAFALRVRGDSMTNPDDRRSLPDGAIVICDPAAVGSWESMHNRIVVAKRTDDQQATLKLLWFDGATPWLKPLNPRYPMLPCPADTRIVAVAKRVEIDL